MQSEYECSWWEKSGETDWVDSEYAGGTKIKWPLYRNMVTGQIVRSNELPIGALFELDRSNKENLNAWPPAAPHDGLAICCVTAGNTDATRRHWYIENRASNCTLPQDNDHRCWVRHGTVGQKIHVDKNGKTCGAGAGSIFMGPDNSWHGFLQNGKLTTRQEQYNGG